MKSIKVNLWGRELGRLQWDNRYQTYIFMFNPAYDDHPDVAPLLHPKGKFSIHEPVYSDDRRIYQNLPPFIADSLPDSWGNKLFDTWVKKNRIPQNKISPLYKLTFIGKRGMGALEFEPAAEEIGHSHKIDIQNLYRLSQDVLNDRTLVHLDAGTDITLQSLLSVGTSAGGRQAKAIVAINHENGEIRSGQISDFEGFDYYIIKFEDELVPTTEIEMAFYHMARAAGIIMMPCDIMEVNGVKHFITQRFDRQGTQKIFTQTLAAINPEVYSYEGLFDTMRRLNLSETEIEQMYSRMVFNIMANNTDDHNKNFSFMLEKEGKWKLAPAYDLTFIFDVHGHDNQKHRCMSIYGKTTDIAKEDLLFMAKQLSIRNPDKIITRVADSLKLFEELSNKYEIPERWSDIISRTLRDNLIAFGYEEKRLSDFTDPKGRKFRNVTVHANRKGIFEIEAMVDGKNDRRFAKPGTQPYQKIHRYLTGKITGADAIRLFESLFS